jgi:CBS domain containing-hemolysin-like protein
MSEGAALAVAVALLAANAFFVGAEFALVSARRTAVEPRAAAGSRAARVTLHAMERVSLMMAGAQLGITVCSLGLGALGEPAVAHLLEPVLHAAGLPGSLLHPLAFAGALAIVVFLHVVVGEMVPKNITLAGPDRAALVLGPPLAGIVVALRPVIVALNAIANLGLRLLRVRPRDEVASAFTREEVADLVAQSRREGLVDPEQGRLLSDALAFGERTVDAVLLPVGRVVAVGPSATVGEVEALAARTGFSRFPVAGITGFTGYLHIKDVLGSGGAAADPVDRRLVRPLPRVRVDEPLVGVLRPMRTTGAHVAQVLDGGDRVVGVVMLEDVLEELVGEIRDATKRR